MRSVRVYHLRNDADYSAHSKSESSLYKLNFLRIIFTTAFFIVCILSVSTVVLVSLRQSVLEALHFGDSVYIVIIDAGSTGSRVNGFKFQVTPQSDLKLEDEIYHATKADLASYVDEPEKGAESILNLVLLAYDLVPPDRRSETPVIVRATAGVRALKYDMSQRLMQAVRDALATTEFFLGPTAVEIMDGDDEGIGSWLTVNYLQDRLKNGTTSAALDMGGGSLQVTYEPVRDPPPRLITMPGLKRNYTLFTHSYSTLGIMAVTYDVLMKERIGNSNYIKSQCIHPAVKDLKWTYKKKNYYISGSDNDLREKYKLCKDFVYRTIRRQLKGSPFPSHLQDFYITALGAFRVPARVSAQQTGQGTIKVSDYIEASELECLQGNLERPWECIGNIIHFVVLQEVLGLSPHKSIHVTNNINGNKISWTLGLAYNTILQLINFENIMTPRMHTRMLTVSVMG